MEYARQHGFPVPAVHDLSDDGTDLVMERVYGPTMLAFIEKRPWALRHQGAVLADLHEQLHEIPAPAWAGDALLSATATRALGSNSALGKTSVR